MQPSNSAFAYLASTPAMRAQPESNSTDAAINPLLNIGHAVLPELKATRDGRLVLLRTVEETDEDLLDQLITGLSPTSRRLRFHGGVRSLPRHLLQRMTRWDSQRELALLAISVGSEKAACVGEARYVVGEGGPDEREFALAIDDEWQSAGLGGAMLGSLVCHARARGVERLVGDVMPENTAMITLARRQGFSVRQHPADARLLQMKLAFGLGEVMPIAASAPQPGHAYLRSTPLPRLLSRLKPLLQVCDKPLPQNAPAKPGAVTDNRPHHGQTDSPPQLRRDSPRD